MALPKVAATPDEVARAESFVGMTFSAESREFLTFANGWTGLPRW